MDQTKAIFKDLFKNIIQEYNEPFINQLKLQENQIKIQENQLKIQENQLKIQETEINTLKELLKKPNIEKKIYIITMDFTKYIFNKLVYIIKES